MKLSIIIIWITITHSPLLKASSLFLPDSDTAALIALVSNTASTVTNTLNILEVAKKTSDQVDKYNFIAMRRFYIARRIEQHARDIVETNKMSPDGLKEINQVLLRLKISLRDLKNNIDYLAQDIYEVENFVDRYWDKVSNSSADEQEAHNQSLSSASEGSMSKHVQNTAMNTALNGKILSKIRRDNLEYQKNDLGLKKGSALEELRREQHYRDWIGLPEEKRNIAISRGVK